MSSRSAFSIRFVTWVVVSTLALFVSASAANAQNSSTNYTFLVAAGFLCDPADSATCPAVVKSANGDSYELSGAGTFDAQNKSTKAAGTYTHKSPNGNVLETGVWLANELVSFDSYGAAPNAIPSLSKGGLGPGATGPKRTPMMMNRGGMPTGGLAVLRIVLIPIAGVSTTAVLQVNCALGDVPHERSVEGIRVTVERNHLEYSEELSGRVMFLAMRPEASMPTKEEEETEQPHN